MAWFPCAQTACVWLTFRKQANALFLGYASSVHIKPHKPSLLYAHMT